VWAALIFIGPRVYLGKKKNFPSLAAAALTKSFS